MMKIPTICLPKGELQEISITELLSSKAPCLYPMSFAFDLQKLKESIKEVGIVNPPLLRCQNAKLQIITGLRRITAARDLGFEKISCRVISAHDLSPKDALLTALHENLTCRQFNVVEKAMILRYLTDHYSTEEILNHFMKILGLAKRKELYHLYIDIEQKLSTYVKESLAKGTLQLKTAALLLTIDQKDADLLVSLANNLKLTTNQFHEFIDITIDLSHIYKTSIQQVLLNPEIADVIDNEKLNIPQKAHRLLEVLRQIRFPTVARVQRKMKLTIEGLHLPEGVKMSLPTFLESSNYRLEVSFQDGNHLKRLLKDILDNRGLESLKSPLAEAMKDKPVGKRNEIQD